jgi:chemotaxis protein methyltransferase CheR
LVDVVTLDIHMPEQNGIEYLQKNFGPSHPPVVMVSSVARENSDLAMKALEAGATDYVEKPALSNLQERGEEIRTKLRVAFQAKLFAAHRDLSLDRDFKKPGVIQKPETKLRVLVASLADRNKVKSLLKELTGVQPATVILVEGAEGVLPDLVKQWHGQSSSRVEVWDGASSALQPGVIYVADFKKSIGSTLAYSSGKMISLCVFGDVSRHAAPKLLEFQNAHLLLEDLGGRRGSKLLHEVATDIFPATSFAALSSEYLNGEKS